MTQVFVLPYDWVIKHVSRDRIADILTLEDITKANRFVHIADRNRFIAARLFLFGLLKQKKIINQSRLLLDYNDFGKPYLSYSNIEFNWSHSGDMIAIIIGMDQCGVDIELLSGKELYDYKSLCSKSELQWLRQKGITNGVPESEQFLDIWTAKESVVKAKGTGLSTDPRDIEIKFDHIDVDRWKCDYESTLFGGTKMIYWDEKKYSLSWCTPINKPIYPILVSDIIKDFLIYI